MKTSLRLSMGLILSGLLTGCQSIEYYSQAVAGHGSIWLNQRDLGEVLVDPAVDQGVKDRLRQLQEVREFASDTLKLPRNDSYTRYADTGRGFVVWNVVATPRYSVVPVKSCFPVVGCVSYRGYYQKQAALEQAELLKQKALDVFVGGVGAYSTLGWFDDPLLNTMLSRSTAESISLIFHELAHQQVFIKGDTQFNESFATAVAQLGLYQWAVTQGETRLLLNYRMEQTRRSEVVNLILQAREAMQQAYEEVNPNNQVALAVIKSQQFEQLNTRYIKLKEAGGGTPGFDRFFATELNHASLALFGEYHGWVAAFKVLFEQNGRDWTDFYQAVERLSKLPYAERNIRLDALLSMSDA